MNGHSDVPSAMEGSDMTAPTPLVTPARPRPASAWTQVALAAPVVAWACVLAPVAVGPLSLIAALTGLTAGTVAVVRDQRTAWRAACGLAALLSLALLGSYAIILTTTTL